MRVGQQLEMYVHGCRYGYSVYAHRGVPADMGKSFKLTVMADNTSRGHGSECRVYRNPLLTFFKANYVDCTSNVK